MSLNFILLFLIFIFKIYVLYNGLCQVHGLILCGIKINTQFRNCLLIYSSGSHASESILLYTEGKSKRKFFSALVHIFSFHSYIQSLKRLIQTWGNKPHHSVHSIREKP